MSRPVLCIFFTFLLLHQTAYGQDPSKLTVPSSPSFSILNYEPTAVMRPTNAKELAADVLNSFDKQGKLLLNLGLEVTPYWLKSNPKLDRNTYLHPTIGQAFLQSLSLSAATVKDSASGNSKLGAGFRFKLLNGEPVEELTIASSQLLAKTTILNAINGVRSTLDNSDTKRTAIDAIIKNLIDNKTDEKVIASVKKQAETLAAGFTDNSENIKKFLELLIVKREASEMELRKEVSELLYARKGFVLEFAGASGYNTSKKNSLERMGLWANASYYVSPDDLFTLTSRYMFNNQDTAMTNFDVGLGFLKKADNYNISIEGMFRWFRAEIPDLNINSQPILRVAKEFTYRIAVQGSVTITNDVSINLNIGKDFDSPFISSSGFFSILGLNYSIFNKKIPALPEANN